MEQQKRGPCWSGMAEVSTGKKPTTCYREREKDRALIMQAVDEAFSVTELFLPIAVISDLYCSFLSC